MSIVRVPRQRTATTLPSPNPAVAALRMRLHVLPLNLVTFLTTMMPRPTQHHKLFSMQIKSDCSIRALQIVEKCHVAWPQPPMSPDPCQHSLEICDSLFLIRPMLLLTKTRSMNLSRCCSANILETTQPKLRCQSLVLVVIRDIFNQLSLARMASALTMPTRRDRHFVIRLAVAYLVMAQWHPVRQSPMT